ncbi:hypothetical protein [Haloechinothrix salitolerans]|uniref:Uncharacterized protein n=1 Tax=Haloechinothrix salitolerans TaxID=926830 RepID=A0ABW2C2B8_9PSEU
MTTTTDSTTAATSDAGTAPAQRGAREVFLWGPGYDLTAREIVNALGSYLASFGDTLGPGGVAVLDAIHAEVVYNGDLEFWTQRKTPAEIATIRARAEQIARDYFRRFPILTW